MRGRGTVTDLSGFLRTVELEHYEAVLRDNAIDLATLRDLTEDHLRELGLPLSARLKLIRAIAALEKPAEASPLAACSSNFPHANTAERRHVTVLFADMVGSTALSSRMDPEDLREIVLAYHKCASETVQRFDGFLAQFLGDGVLVYFGYPRAHEDDAKRAVMAGLKLIEAVTSLNTRAALQTRVGIATGSVVVGDLMRAGDALDRGIIGETPNLAARLQALAEPDTVVLDEGTRKLLGSLFELQDLGSRELRGIPRRVQIWVALRASSAPSRFEALHGAGLGAFVGREQELEVLESCLEKARSQIYVIDLVAEAGMGKSRLLHQFRRRIGKERAFILSGNCSPDRQETPFHPFLDVVRGSFRLSAADSEKDVAQKLEIGLTAVGLHSSRNLALLLHLLGLKVTEGALMGLDGVLIGLRTRDLLEQLLAAISTLSPIIMMIEDLQWIDSVSEELLVRIVHSKTALRLLLLHTRRPEYAPAWLEHPSVAQLALAPLPDGDIRRLAEERLAVEALPETLVQHLSDKAEGNPLFAEEIVSFLVERGMLRTSAGKLEFDARAAWEAVPTSVQGLLTARVDRLAPKDRALLQGASVIGRRFDSDLLAVALDDRDEIDSRLLVMQSLDLIRASNRSSEYLFKHALVRDALYQSLLSDARRSLHLKIADEIERRSRNRLTEVAEVLAHHYNKTDHESKAFAYLIMAGQKCLSVYSLDEAATHFGSAVTLLDNSPRCASDDQVGDFLVSYTLLLNISTQWTQLIRLLERHLPRLAGLKDNQRVVLIRHHYVIALLYNTRYREAVSMQRETMALAERLGDAGSRAYALAGEIFVSSVVSPKRLDEFDLLKGEAIKAANATTDAYIKNWARYVIGQEEYHRGRVNQARGLAQELMEVGRQMNDPRSVGLGLSLLTSVALVSDSYLEALEYSETSLAVAVTPIDRSIALGGKGTALILLRRVEEGANLLASYRQRCAANGEQYALAISDVVISVCKVFQGNISSGVRSIEEGICKQDKDGYCAAADWYRGFLAEIYLQILAREEDLPFLVLVKNLSFLAKAMFKGSSHIRALMAAILDNPRYDPAGLHVGRAQMLLGLLCKIEKKPTQAIQHLMEARRIISQFGETPMLTRVEAALAALQ